MTKRNDEIAQELRESAPEPQFWACKKMGPCGGRAESFNASRRREGFMLESARVCLGLSQIRKGRAQRGRGLYVSGREYGARPGFFGLRRRRRRRRRTAHGAIWPTGWARSCCKAISTDLRASRGAHISFRCCCNDRRPPPRPATAPSLVGAETIAPRAGLKREMGARPLAFGVGLMRV